MTTRVEMESEAALLARLRSKDQSARRAAEEVLYATFESRVRAVLSRVVGSGAELDDAVQEAFVDIFRGVPRFQGRAGLGTWIYRVALRRGWKCAAREKAAKQNRVPLDLAREPIAESTSAGELEAKELARRLEAALLELDLEQRSILALSAREELPPPEIAEILGACRKTHSE